MLCRRVVSGVNASERIYFAFEPQGTPEIGVVIPYEEIYIRDRWEDLTSCPWWYRYAPEIDLQIQWWTDVRRFLDVDWYAVPCFYSRSERKHIFIDHRLDGDYLVNSLTDLQRKIERPPVGGWNKEGAVESARPVNPPDTFEEINRRIKLPQETGEETDLEGRDDFAKALRDGPAKDLYPIAHVSSPLWNCYGLWGFEGLMIRIAERRDLVEYACRRLLLRQLYSIKRSAALGAKAIWIEECMTDMIHPDVFAELNVPLIAQMADEIRSQGMKSIYYFCGNPAGKLEHILATQTDALAFEESKKGFNIDIEQMSAYLNGRRTLLGNLDAVNVLQEGSEEDLRHEIARQLKAGRSNKSRFILSVGSPVTPLTPPERVRLYCDIAHELSAA
ncbi:MAG: uroporphyrinogen decarboxylase family protein [Armatimonadota bacterium]|nr:uroporphyrinogen decarboxylase family protein [Armatimonadota bacterium]